MRLRKKPENGIVFGASKLNQAHSKPVLFTFFHPDYNRRPRNFTKSCTSTRLRLRPRCSVLVGCTTDREFTCTTLCAAQVSPCPEG